MVINSLNEDQNTWINCLQCFLLAITFGDTFTLVVYYKRCFPRIPIKKLIKVFFAGVVRKMLIIFGDPDCIVLHWLLYFLRHEHLIQLWVDLSRIPVNKGIKSRHGWTKYNDLYEIVHPSLNLIFLCLITGVDCGKGLLGKKVMIFVFFHLCLLSPISRQNSSARFLVFSYLRNQAEISLLNPRRNWSW